MERLGKNVSSPGGVGLFTQTGCAVSRDNHRHHGWTHALEMPTKVQAVHPRHPQIEQSQVVRLANAWLWRLFSWMFTETPHVLQKP
jgi:hypothetical protein